MTKDVTCAFDGYVSTSMLDYLQHLAAMHPRETEAFLVKCGLITSQHLFIESDEQS